MPIHKLTLLGRRNVAKDTIVFVFEKPEGFTFKPGQYGGFTLIDPKEIDPKGTTRRFSLLSTPDDDHILIVTRIQQSAFKRILSEMPIGSEIKFAGPTGAFVLHEEASVPAVFIAGGMGIAPFYSMIRHVIKRESLHQLVLFYGNQTIDDAAFLTELTTLQSDQANFTLIPTMVNADPSWQGETGFITDTLIKKHIHDLATPIFYICGAPIMVTAIKTMLSDMSIDESRICVEDFPGY